MAVTAARLRASNRRVVRLKRQVARNKARGLTPAQRQDRNPLYNPLTPLTGHRLASTVKQEVGLQLNPQLAALNRQGKSVQTQYGALSNRVGGYYTKIAQEAQTQQDRQNAINAQLKTDTAAVGQRQQATLDTAGQQATQSAEADAALRGSGLSGGGQDQVQTELAAEKARAGSQAASSEQRAGEIGALGSMLMNELASARASRGGEAQTQLTNSEANKLWDIAQQRATLAASRGGLTAKTLSDERQKQFDNLVAMKTLGVKQADLQAQTQIALGNQALAGKRLSSAEKHNRALQREANKRINLQANSPSSQKTKQEIAYFKTHGYYPQTGPGKQGAAGKPQFTQTQVRSNHNKLDKAMAQARSDIGAGHLQKGGVQQFAQLYGSQKGDPLLWRVAADLALNGDVDPKYAKQFFERYGVRVRARKPKKPPLATGQGSGSGIGQFGPGGL